MLCPQNNCFPLYFRQNVTRLSVGLLMICHIFAVSCKIVYRWVTTNCCCMSDMRHLQYTRHEVHPNYTYKSSSYITRHTKRLHQTEGNQCFSENNTKYTNSVSSQNAEFLKVTVCVSCRYQCALRGQNYKILKYFIVL